MSADFVVIRALNDKLSAGNSVVNRNFDAPGVNPSREAVLQYVAKTTADEGENVLYQIKINDKDISLRGLDNGDSRSIHDVVRPNILKAENNELNVKLFDGEELLISDVILFYK
jgi:hypothetical protein